MRRSTWFMAAVVVLMIGVVACVPSPSDPPGDPWGDGCADDRDPFKEWGTNDDEFGEWWYWQGSGAAATVGLTDEFGAPVGYGCHAGRFASGPAGAEPSDNTVQAITLSKFESRMSNVNSIQYHSYRSSGSDTEERVTLGMRVAIISFFAPNFSTVLHYEPHRQSGGAANVVDDEWQRWDATQGRWWTEQDGPERLYTWTELQLRYYDARIGAHGLGVPAGHPGLVLGGEGVRFGDMRTNFGATFPDLPIGGTTTTTTTTTPPLLPPQADNVAVAVGQSHSCAVKTSGQVSCWGSNINSQLGDGTSTSRSFGAPVIGIDDAVDVAAGANFSCALSRGGSVRCWGANWTGQLGNGGGPYSATPVQVVGLESGVVAIDAYVYSACALLEDGTARCWGENDEGQLGNGDSGTRVMSPVPVEVQGLEGVADIATGSCAVATGGAQCWGRNASGRLGDGTTDSSPTPVGVAGLDGDVLDVTTANHHSCAITTAGSACWGILTGLNSTVPVPVPGLDEPLVAIEAGVYRTCAITASGAAKCWGNSSTLGNGSEHDSATPVQVAGLTSGVTAIDAHSGHVCAVVDGLVMCWGLNSEGQLGDGNEETSSRLPVLAYA